MDSSKANLVLEKLDKKLGFGQTPPLFGPKDQIFPLFFFWRLPLIIIIIIMHGGDDGGIGGGVGGDDVGGVYADAVEFLHTPHSCPD